MANRIQLRRSTSDPVGGDLLTGELGLNTSTGDLFLSTDGSTVTEINAGTLDGVGSTQFVRTDVSSIITAEQTFSAPMIGPIGLSVKSGFADVFVGLYLAEFTSGDAQGFVGFPGSFDMVIRNYKDGNTLTLQGSDTPTGAWTNLLVGDPDGAVDLYYDAAKAVATDAQGVNVYDSVASGTTPTIKLRSQAGTQQAEIASYNTGFIIKNMNHGENLTLQAENAGGSTITLFQGDPDGASKLYYADASKVHTLPGGALTIGDHSADTFTVSGDITHTTGDWILGSTVHGGNVTIQSEDLSGNTRTCLEFDPDGDLTLRRAGGAIKFIGTSLGVDLYGGGTTAEFNWNTLSTNFGRVHIDVIGNRFSLDSLAVSDSLHLRATDSGSVLNNLLLGDPNAAVSLWYDGVATARTATAATGGLEANNTSTGAGWERVLTTSDIPTAYTHPTHPGDDFSVDTLALTGATVVSDIDINVTTDTLGHVTDANGTVATRVLTLADLGYTGSPTANDYTLPFTDNSANWDTAFGWGDHAGLYATLAATQTFTGANTFTAEDTYFTHTGATLRMDNLGQKGMGCNTGFANFMICSGVGIADDLTKVSGDGAVKLKFDTDGVAGVCSVIAYPTNATAETVPPGGVTYSFNTTEFVGSRVRASGKLLAGAGEIVASSAVLQAAGFMRTGSIYLHEGTTPAASTDKILENVSGALRWDANDVWHTGNDGDLATLSATQSFTGVNTFDSDTYFGGNLISTSTGGLWYISNLDAGENIQIRARNVGDTAYHIGVQIDPDNAVTAYYNNAAKLLTSTIGIRIRGEFNNADGGSQDTRIEFEDSDGSDVGQMGFLGTPDMYMRSVNNGGRIVLDGQNTAGTLQTLQISDPDAGTQFYHTALLSAETAVDGFSIQDTNGTSAYLHFKSNVGALQGEVISTSTSTYLRNRTHGGTVRLDGENASGTTKNCVLADPDTDVKQYYAGVEVTRTATAANGGFQVLNTFTGSSSAFRRVLTEDDCIKWRCESDVSITNDIALSVEGDWSNAGTTGSLYARTYAIEGFLYVQTATTPGVTFDFSLAAGSLAEWRTIWTNNFGTSTANLTAQARDSQSTYSTVVQFNGGNCSTYNYIQVSGFCRVTTAVGMQLRFAQASSSGTATILQHGSWIKFTPVNEHV